MSAKIMYCIECAKTVMLEPIVDRNVHVVITSDFPKFDIDWCAGPFTSSAPLKLEEDWERHLEDPSSDELLEMDAVASELLTEFELI